jgi:lipopolysaccharide/colanic/teichoic acid biosynthesis glycosyltransferase
MSTLIKRGLDILLVLFSGIISLPFVLIIAIILRFSISKPVFFCQERPGFKGIPFKMFKFRTMTDKKDSNGNLLPDKDRLTKFGRFLRVTSLDELPEILNVLKGEMSLVGPRPLAMEYLERYNSEQARRHDVKPGITGLAQVSGRNLLSWEEKFKLDVWYVDHWSLFLDLKILCKTLKMVLIREGVVPEGRSVLQDFMGSENSQQSQKEKITK